MKRLLTYAGRSTYSGRDTGTRLPAEVHTDQRSMPAEQTSSLSYQLVTIAAAVLLVVSAAVLW